MTATLTSPMTTDDPNSLPASAPSRSVVVWHGLRLELPNRWDPVKLDGDADDGFALFVDMHRPRLGLRWKKMGGKRFDPQKWAERAMREEVGQLAAEEARPLKLDPDLWSAGLLYEEPEPPGRDVVVAYSKTTGRAIELIYHARRRERILADAILPTLRDLPPDARRPWSIFELSCVAPPGLALERRVLNVGDLSLTFADKRHTLIVRQIAVAELALKRMTLEQWLRQQQRVRHKHYRPARTSEPMTVEASDGRELTGFRSVARRRLRFALAWWRPKKVITCALHDTTRDRIVIVESDEPSLVDEILPTIGWARTGENRRRED